MPEAAVDEDHLALAGKVEGGRPGQGAAMQAEAVAAGVDEAAGGELGAGALRSNARHAFGALGARSVGPRRSKAPTPNPAPALSRPRRPAPRTDQWRESGPSQRAEAGP